MASEKADLTVEIRSIGNVDTEVITGGSGAPILVLHGFHNLTAQSAFLRQLTAYGTVHAPSLPGFGHSIRPDDFDSVYDLVHFCLDFIDSLPDEALTIVGLSFGGWLAMELAIKQPHHLDRLVLVDSLGVKLSDRETPDIADIFNLHPDEVHARSWADRQAGKPDFDAMSDDEIVVYATNRESLCLYGWHPYMYTPQLANWLHRIRTPTLALWGESDGIVDLDYGRGLAARIPGARFEIIAGAGHHPEVEQPESLVQKIGAFLAQPQKA